MPASPKRPAKALTIINLKGGVGKTHTVWLLAGVCEERGLRCLCVDLDTQGNLTRNLLDGGSSLLGVEGLFHPGSDAEAVELVRRSRFEHIDLIPSSSALGPFDLADQRAWEGADLQRSLVDALENVRGDYDYILCDCPPRLSLVSFAALMASDHVIIPLEAADWGAQGVRVAITVEPAEGFHGDGPYHWPDGGIVDHPERSIHLPGEQNEQRGVIARVTDFLTGMF